MIRWQYEGFRAFALGWGLVVICGCPTGGAAGDSGDSGQRPIDPDTGIADTTARDRSVADAAASDIWDAPPRDARPQDALPRDARPQDTQPPDAPLPDVRPHDTRPPDTAPPPPDSAADTPAPDSAVPDTSIVSTKPCKPGVGWATGVTLPTSDALSTWQPKVQPGLATARTTGQACTGPRSGSSAVLCVDDDNSTGSESGTATAPYRMIHTAIDAAADGDLIQIAGGSYGENLVILDKGVHLVGGFAGADSYGGGSSGDFVTRIPAQYVTTVVGQGGGSAIDILSANPAVIDGLRIIKGTGNEGEARFYYLGGGICVGESTVTIQHCLIEDNDIVTSHPDKAMDSLGGAVHGADSRLTLYANIVRNNRSGRGAIAIDGPQTRIESNAIVDNVSVGDHGGGLYLSGADIVVLDNLVARNRIEPNNGQGGWGGGILVFNSNTQALLQGNLVTGNSAPFQGSGVFIDDAARATLVNELIYANVCTQLGGTAVYVDADDNDGPSTATMNNVTIAGHVCSSETGGNALLVENSDATITNSIIWANGGDDFILVGSSSLAVDHSITDESVSGDNNQRLDPIFADPPNDFHLCSTGGRYEHDGVDAAWVVDNVHSPAIDSGDPAAAVGNETQPNGSRLNRGAYGSTAQASRSD